MSGEIDRLGQAVGYRKFEPMREHNTYLPTHLRTQQIQDHNYQLEEKLHTKANICCNRLMSSGAECVGRGKGGN